MTISSKTPLTHCEADLQDFPFMPLDVLRLRDSNLAISATGEEFRAAVLLWCASWHQIPAGSLPNDDAQLSQFAGFGRVLKEWKKVKSRALSNWQLCSDGRLYHPVVAEKVNEAWIAKLKQRWMTECARIKKHNDRHRSSIPKPDFDEWLSLGCPQGQPLSVPRDKKELSQGTEQGQGGDVPRETHSKRQRQGQGQRQVVNNDVSDLDSTEAEKTESSSSTPPGHPENKPPERNPIQVRAVEISVLLRDRGAKVQPGQPQLLEWASTGVTDAQLLTALEKAQQQRDEKADPSPINAGFINVFVNDQKRKTLRNAQGHDRPLTQAEKRSQVAAFQFRNLPEYQNHADEPSVIDITPAPQPE